MKKIINMILFVTALATASMLSCNSPDLVPEAPMTLEYSIIDGDTIKTRTENLAKDFREKGNFNYSFVVEDKIITAKGVKLHTLSGKEPDLKKLKNEKDELVKGKPLQYVAIGGSLTAGFRDGGYFNGGIETSFANILAHHLRIKEFKQPLFDVNDYNGYGRNEPTDLNPTGGPVQKYARSKNNLGFEISSEKEIKPKKVKEKYTEYSNLGIPDLNQTGLDFGLSLLYPNGSKPYFDRFYWEQGGSKYGSGGIAPLEQFKKLHKDIFTIEFIQEAVNESQGVKPTFDIFGAGPGGREEPLAVLLDDFAKKGMKGALANIPNSYNFPINKVIDLKTYYTYSRMTKYPIPNTLEELIEKATLIPSIPNTDSLVSSNVNIALKQKLGYSYLMKSEIQHGVDVYNNTLNQIAKNAGFPVVDIEKLYENILSGRYRTDDGVKVDPSLTGNFFSSDNVNPSPFGNAIIANEFIRTLNSYYKLDIPLIPTKEYLNIK